LYAQRQTQTTKNGDGEDVKVSQRLPVLGEDDKFMEVDIPSDEEREKVVLREKRAEEKEEHLRQLARERREKRKAVLRARRGLPPKEVESSSSEESSSENGSEMGASEFDDAAAAAAEAEENSLENSENTLSKSPKSSKLSSSAPLSLEDDPDMLELRLFAQRQQEIASQKEKLAYLAGQILEDPDRNLRRMRDLHEFCEVEDITVRKLGILSELKIFHDIIPSYRIVVGADAGVQLSKDVKKLRDFESQILDCYQVYLTTLDGLLYQTKEILKAKGEQIGQARAKENGGHFKRKSYGKWRPSSVDISQMTEQGIEAMIGLGRVAAMAMGELLVRHHHFNFRANLIMALVPLLNTSDVQLGSIVSDSIRRLFTSDSKGSSALECARTISQLVKKKEFKVRPIVIDVLRSLRLRKPLEDGDSIFSPTSKHGKSKKHLSRKDQKKAKKDKEIEKELKETEAVESKQDRDTLQTETLKVIFLLYFNILKNTKRSPLLPTVLEAMAHFSHLINLDLLLNLVELLKDVIADRGIPLESSMHTVITAFQAIKLQGDTLTVDLKEFYSSFYPLLEPAMSSPSKYSVLVPLLVRSLELMLTHRRILALDRVAAYAKRILTLSLHLPPQSVIAILMVLNQILRKYPKTQQLLDTEFSGMGTYMPELKDPEHCNAFAATAWEFSLLTEHVHPSVTNLARMVLNQDPITEQNVLKLYNQFEFAQNGIVPSMTKPRPHVFQKSITKAQKAGRDNIYFVRPSELFDQSEFAKKIETQKQVLTSKANSNNLFQQYYQDVQSLMDMDGEDDDLVSLSEDE
jgi:nucleolar complex protein 3